MTPSEADPVPEKALGEAPHIDPEVVGRPPALHVQDRLLSCQHPHQDVKVGGIGIHVSYVLILSPDMNKS